MTADIDVAEALRTHPCYNEDAHRSFARMHLPVAPRCNIQCNYCNRKYDCTNESRPGVTSQILSPMEAADKIRIVKKEIPQLKVIAIAGPGDPLANEETFETFDIVRTEFPDMTLCVSTNGLMLPKYAQRLYDLNIRFLTVTMNATDPAVTKDVYDSVIWEGRRLTGVEAAQRLLSNQLDGIKKCISLGMVVKINIVLIPGINDKHIPDLVKELKSLGVYIINILPLIPVEGTRFSDMTSPTPEERKSLMDRCSVDVRMMRHCRQCRADAIGLLDNDRSHEFINAGTCGSGCGPKIIQNEKRTAPDIMEGEEIRIAVASSDGDSVDSGFGNTKKFKIYATDGNVSRFLETRNVAMRHDTYGESHARHVSDTLDLIDDCAVVVVSEIGPRPEKELISRGKKLLISSGTTNDSVIEAAMLLKK